MERLLTVEDAADQLGTSVRFVRRLIFERRIAFVKVGRHVRIASADLDASGAGAGAVWGVVRGMAADDGESTAQHGGSG